ncbi:MAG: AI-2E family transporter [Gemmatimonadota bacterium]
MATASGVPPQDQSRPRARARDPRVMLLAGLLLLAVFYTLYFARGVVVPVTIAVLLNFLFSPVVRWLKKRLRFPFGFSAALIILALVSGLVFTFYNLAAPAAAWVSKGPRSLKRVEAKLRVLRRPVDEVSKTAERVEEMTNSGGNEPATVQLKEAGLKEAIFGNTRSLLVGGTLVFTLLFFLLAGGDLFMAKLIKVLPRLRDKKLALTIAVETEKSVSTYLAATTAINVGLGVLTGLSVYLIGLPNPVLWGIVGGLLNFIPYVGGFIAVIVLGLAGMATFDGTTRALMPAAAYFLLTNLESFVTPYILGSSLALNPVVVFISVLFWGWLWGIAGALLAVPIMATVKIFCDHMKMTALGEFLGK